MGQNKRQLGSRILLYLLLLVCSLVFSGCASNGVTNVVNKVMQQEVGTIGENEVTLSADQVQITEEQYQQFEQIRTELHHVVLEKWDPVKLKKIYEKIPVNDFQEAGSCFLSSVPYIVWDYEHNDIYEVRLLAFSKDRSVCYHIMIGWMDGKLDYQSMGYVGGNCGVDNQIIPENQEETLIILKADYYHECFFSQNNQIFQLGDYVTAQEGVSDQFDFDRMGVSFQKATDLDVCVKIDLS